MNIIIIGCGRVGRTLAEKLNDDGNDVTVIDMSADKVKKITGLDLRLFDHAIVFKVALMVKKYLVSKPMRI